MRGATLDSILDLYRAETRVSLNAAHNTQVREPQVKLLQRVQTRLWDEFDWPHLIVERDYPFIDGQSLYDVGADFDIDRIFKIKYKDGEVWRDVSPTLTADAYSVWDSQTNEKAWPVRRFRIFEGEQLEFWPTPDRNGDTVTKESCFKVRGVRRLNNFVADNDKADLDDHLIALFAAAESLAAAGAKDAQLKLDQAKARQAHLQGNMTMKRRFRMFGRSEELRGYRRPAVFAYKPPE